MSEDHVSASYKNISAVDTSAPQNYTLNKFPDTRVVGDGAKKEIKVGQESLVPTLNSLIAKFDQYTIQETILLQSYNATPDSYIGIDVTKCLIANLPDVRQQLADAVTELDETRLSTMKNTDLHAIYDACGILNSIAQSHIDVINFLLSPLDGQKVIEEYPEGIENYLQSEADKILNIVNNKF